MPGVAVDLYAWPSDAVLKALKPGELVPTTLLATASTNSAGGYTLRVPAARLKAAAVESGYANLEIFSSAAGMWFLPYQTGSRPSSPATVNLGGKKGPPSCGLTPQHREYNFTGFHLERHRANAWAVVGQGYIVRKGKSGGDYVQFKYTEGSSHSQASTLGVGVSGYGVEAGYQHDGHNSSTAHRAAGFPNAHGSGWFRTLFSTGQFRGICYGPARDSNIPYQKQHGKCPHTITDKQGALHYVHKCFWLIRSTGWFGGTSIVAPAGVPHTPKRLCAPYLKGSDFGGDFGTAVEWSSGFDLGLALGLKGVNLKASFDGSAQTGYDKDAFMDYFFPRHGGYLCGTHGSNDTAPILVQAGERV